MAFGRFDVKGDDHDVQPAPPISIPPPSARAKNVAFVEGDISKAVPDGSFDAAVGRCVLFFVADPAAALRRIVATVRPGGNVAFHARLRAEVVGNGGVITTRSFITA